MPSQAVLELMINLKDNASSGLASLGGAVGKLGIVAGGVALAGVAALGAAVVSGIGDAREAAKIYAQTENVIRSTGGAAGVSADQVSDLAASLSAAAGKSLFGDDDIQQSTNLLLTFTNIKEGALEAATAISVDMAQALGGAPKDAAIQLGKALNDPIAGISALSRVGVSFTDQQKEQIKTMQEAGDMAGAQAVILAELNKEFGGSAQAAADADGGWAQFNDRMGEAKETLGAALLPLLGMLVGVLNDSVIPIVEAGALAFGNLVNYFTAVAEDGDTLNDFLSSLPASIQPIVQIVGELAVWLGENLPAAIAAILPLFTGDMPAALGTTGETFAVLQSTITAVMGAIQAVVAAVLPQIAAFWAANGEQIMGFVKTTWDAIQGIIQTALQIIQAIIVPILAAIAGFINAHGTEIQAILKATWDSISGVITVALGLIQGILKTVLLAIQGDWSGAWEMLKQTSAEFVQGILDVVTTVLGDLEGVFDGAVASIKSIWAGLVSSATTIGSNIIQGIISGVKSAASSLYSTLSNIAGDALQAAKDAIGIGSPSKDFADEVGNPIVTGIIQGIQSTAGSLVRAMTDLTSGLLSGAADAVDEMGSAIFDADTPDTSFIGEGIIDGIIDGMKGATRGLVTYIESTASTVEEALADAFGISSPSERMAGAIGTPIVQGIMQGITESWGGLTDLIGSISGDLITDMESIGRDMQQAIADGFGATASIDRQVAKNLDKFKDVLPQYEQYTTGALNAAQKQAEAFLDPAEGAKFFRMRSDQILEYAKLQKQLSEAATEEDRKRIEAQMLLINAAQTAEISQFEANQLATQSATEKMADAIGDIMGTIAGITLTEDQIKIVDMLASVWSTLTDIPGRASGGFVGANQPYWVGERGPELFMPQQSGTIVPNGAAGMTFHNVFNLPPGTTDQIADAVIRKMNAQVRGRL